VAAVNRMEKWQMLLRWLRDIRTSLSLFTFSVAVLVAAIFYVALSIENLLGDYAASENSHAILDGLYTTRNAVETRVNTLRSYVNNGNENLLVEYRSANSAIVACLANLNGLSRGNAIISKQVSEIQRTIATQSAVADRMLEAYQRGQLRYVRQLINEDDTRLRTLDLVRTAITAVELNEHASLSASTEHAGYTLRVAIYVGTLGLTLYFIVQCIVFARMDKESELRRSADYSLLKTNAELESSLEQLRGHDRVARAIGHFGEILQDCRSVGEAITLTVRQISDFLPAVSIDVGLLNESRNAVEFLQWKDPMDGRVEPTSVQIKPEDCWGLRRGRVHIYRSNSSIPRCDHISDGATHSMCIPILGHCESRGIISLWTADTAVQQAGDWEVGQKIAERLAPALGNLKLQETLRNDSIRDRLTGLFNRRYLDESLAREISRARRHNLPVSVMMLDIDHFKQFNDEHGHEGGDVILRHFGGYLARSVRGEDIACRYGGEEFTLVLPGASHDIALRRAELVRLMGGASRDLAIAKITTSIGVATFPEHGESMEDILTAADAALYLAKNSGRNRVLGASTLRATNGSHEKRLALPFA
jgi:diguanylate cyclase (GGDEF)-like protein